jgi:2-phospho-L-lactate guanylyltransferase
MRTLVPFDAVDPKERLSPALDTEERAAFARAMLADVLAALEPTPAEPTVLSTAPLDPPLDVPVAVDDRPLSTAVNARLGDGPLAVVMADLALATPRALARLYDHEGPVVLAPGRGGGTNCLVVRTDGFRVDYHGASVRDHRRAARETGAEPAEVDSFRLATDVDEPADLVEVLLHSDGRARDWLRRAGYRVHTTGGRVRAARDTGR